MMSESPRPVLLLSSRRGEGSAGPSVPHTHISPLLRHGGAGPLRSVPGEWGGVSAVEEAPTPPSALGPPQPPAEGQRRRARGHRWAAPAPPPPGGRGGAPAGVPLPAISATHTRRVRLLAAAVAARPGRGRRGRAVPGRAVGLGSAGTAPGLPCLKRPREVVGCHLNLPLRLFGPPRPGVPSRARRRRAEVRGLGGRWVAARRRRGEGRRAFLARSAARTPQLGRRVFLRHVKSPLALHILRCRPPPPPPLNFGQGPKLRQQDRALPLPKWMSASLPRSDGQRGGLPAFARHEDFGAVVEVGGGTQGDTAVERPSPGRSGGGRHFPGVEVSLVGESSSRSLPGLEVTARDSVGCSGRAGRANPPAELCAL